MPVHTKVADVWDTIGNTGVYYRMPGVAPWYDPAYEDFDVAQPYVDVVWVKRSGSWTPVWVRDLPPPDGISYPTAGYDAIATVENGAKFHVAWGGHDGLLLDDIDHTDVEHNVNGGAFGSRVAVVGNALFNKNVGTLHGSTIQARVRLVDDTGQVPRAPGTAEELWTLSNPVTLINVLPLAATGVSVAWTDASGGGFNVSWTDPANPYSDMQAMKLYYKRTQDAAYSGPNTIAYTGGGHTSFVAAISRDTLHNFVLRSTNNAGIRDVTFNAYSKPAAGAQKLITPTDSASWQVETSSYFTGDRDLRQGRIFGVLFQGAWYYGSNISTAMRGYLPVTAEIFMQKYQNANPGPVSMFMHGHPSRPNATMSALSGTIQWMTTSWFPNFDDGSWEVIPSGNYDEMASGAARGIGIFTFAGDAGSVRHIRGVDTGFSSGVIRLTY